MTDPQNQLSTVGEYRSFLVRLWQSNAEGIWHASVQSIQTGTILHFVDLTALFTFLDTQTALPLADETQETPHLSHS